jgi:NADPH-dependent glutamate synthase beta subunit-like oxidoreductase
MIKRHMRCAINPAIGDERFLNLKPARQRLRVAVVGGGPGGLEAARIARLRGHQVTVLERTGELGGAILYCCGVPGKHKMRWYADWLRGQIRKLGVEVCLHTAPTVDQLRAFDAVVVATGGRVPRPQVPGIDLPHVVTFEDILRCGLETCEHYCAGKAAPAETGGTVLVWGDHFAAADSAEKLAAEGKKVLVVTENDQFAEWMEPCHRDVMLKRFACSNGEGLKGKPFAQPVTVMPRTSVVEIRPGGEVLLMNNRFEKSSWQVDTVVLAAVAADDGPYGALLETGMCVVRIGDAASVRNLRAAVTEGAQVGLTLDAGAALNANRALLATA